MRGRIWSRRGCAHPRHLGTTLTYHSQKIYWTPGENAAGFSGVRAACLARHSTRPLLTQRQTLSHQGYQRYLAQSGGFLMRFHLILAVLALNGAWTSVAEAQDLSQARAACAGSEPTCSLVQQVAACTALIDAGDATSGNLAGLLDNRGMALAQQHEYGRALADFDEAIRLSPDNATAFYNRGRAHTGQKQYTQAISDFDEAIRLKPDFAAAFSNRGIVYGELNQNSRVIADFDEAVRIKPNDASAANVRGLGYARLQQYARAVTDYDTAIRL